MRIDESLRTFNRKKQYVAQDSNRVVASKSKNPTMQSVDGLSQHSPRFDLGPVHVEFVVDIVTVADVFLRLLRLFAVSIIPLPTFHTQYHIRHKDLEIDDVVK